MSSSYQSLLIFLTRLILKWQGATCVEDVNECTDNLNICNAVPNSQCNNLNGSYECNCVSGYQKLKVCQWLSTGRWFSLGPPVSSTNKTDRHDITEILLKVASKTNKRNNNLPWQFPFASFSFTTSVVICTDCINPYDHGHDGPWDYVCLMPLWTI
jgi:hypothetical protein